MAQKEGLLLFKEKQIKVLLALADKSQEWYLSRLAGAAGATYVHTSKFITRCEVLGMINVVKHGKVKTISLTEKGNAIVKGISGIMEQIALKEKQEPEAAEKV